MSGFVECDTCRKKPGPPVLCDGCLSNRATIETLKAKNKTMELLSKLAKEPYRIGRLQGMEELHDGCIARIDKRRDGP